MQSSPHFKTYLLCKSSWSKYVNLLSWIVYSRITLLCAPCTFKSRISYVFKRFEVKAISDSLKKSSNFGAFPISSISMWKKTWHGDINLYNDMSRIINDYTRMLKRIIYILLTLIEVDQKSLKIKERVAYYWLYRQCFLL